MTTQTWHDSKGLNLYAKTDIINVPIMVVFFHVFSECVIYHNIIRPIFRDRFGIDGKNILG